MRRTRGHALRAMVSASLLVATSLVPSTSRAEDSTAHELRYDVGLDLAVTGGSLALVLASAYLFEPTSCRWCDRDAGRDSLNGVDRWARRSLRWKDPSEAQLYSNLTAFVLQPAAVTLDMYAAATHDRARRAVPADFLIIGEAATVSVLLNETAKLFFARERPYAHHRSDEERARTERRADDHLSFYSGHTSTSFALAAASGTVASLRGYRLAPLVWSTLVPLAALTGYLRIAADRHYLTDVVVGMVVGSAVGALLPLVFHGRQGDALVSAGSGPGAAPRSLSGAPQMLTFGGGF